MPEYASWDQVAHNMTTDYRNTVARLALGQLAQAEPELQQFTLAGLSRVKVPGFRSFPAAYRAHAQGRLIAPVAQAMLQSAPAAGAVICLWSTAVQAVIDELVTAAKERGIEFKQPGSWFERAAGFTLFDPDEYPLAKLAEELGEGRPEDITNHFRLGVFWLSSLVTDEPASAEEAHVPESQQQSGDESPAQATSA